MDKFRENTIRDYFAWCEKNWKELVGLDIDQKIDKFLEYEKQNEKHSRDSDS